VIEGRSKSEIVEKDELVASIHNHMSASLQPEEVLQNFAENRAVLKRTFEELLQEVVERRETMVCKKKEMEAVVEVVRGNEEKAGDAGSDGGTAEEPV
jgi:hypothetical protein